MNPPNLGRYTSFSAVIGFMPPKMQTIMELRMVRNMMLYPLKESQMKMPIAMKIPIRLKYSMFLLFQY